MMIHIHQTIPALGLAVLLLLAGTVQAELPVPEPAGLDTIRVEAGCSVSLPDTAFTAGADTVLLLPQGTECVIKTPSQIKSDAFYQSQESQSGKGLVRETIFGAILKESRGPAQSTEVVKSETPFIPFQGMTIRSIRIKKVDTWSGSVHDTLLTAQTGLSRALNTLHTQTRDKVLQNNLRFAEGDTLNALVMADNERLLRNLPYIEDARIYLMPNPEDTRAVDVLVVTKDVFPWGMGGSISSVNSFYVRPFNRNVLGYGHEISYKYRHDNRKSPSSGHEIKYFIESALLAAGRPLSVDQLQKLFDGRTDGFYIEVGAYDGATFAVIVFPFRFQVEETAPPPVVQERIGSFCDEEGLTCLDLLPVLRAAGPESFLDYDHLSRSGARLVARTLQESPLLPEGYSNPRDLERCLQGRDDGGAEAVRGWLEDPASPLPEVGVEALVQVLGDADAAVRMAAAWGLEKLGPGTS